MKTTKNVKSGVWFTGILMLLLVSGCVSSKKYQEAVNAKDAINTTLEACQREMDAVENELDIRDTKLANYKNKVSNLNQQIDYFKQSNTLLLDRLEDLSVVSKTGVESIKESLETLRQRNAYIERLTSSIQWKDSVNLILVMNLKRSLGSIYDEDIEVEVRKGVVYVSLSDKMMFPSGSAKIGPEASRVLGKIASVVNDHEQLDLLIEGHTDNVNIGQIACVDDNWDLSVKRSTEVVRVLQEKYNVDPSRMTAAGRSKFDPKASNDTREGRQLNRRTEIIILPKLDEFFSLLEPKEYEKLDLNY